MKQIILLLFWLSLPVLMHAQWSTLNIPEAIRYDDIFFLNEDTGFAANGNGAIYKTVDGGLNWNINFISENYLRSIEFATPTLGFCGGIHQDGVFYKTTNGGQTWVDISSQFNPNFTGICGLAAPTSQTIYGCGVWFSPAYVIKTSDGGNTWSTKSFMGESIALIDMYFFNADTGFVTGRGANASEGGAIFYTTDGGDNWTKIFQTNVSGDYIWKIQSPDGVHFFASIQSDPFTQNVRMLRSFDRGLNWTIDTIFNSWSYVQTIGFLDSLHGFTGGEQTLYETTNGGISWDTIQLGSSYNRFFRISENEAYLTGDFVYKYKNTDNSILKINQAKHFHNIDISPNPGSQQTINIQIQLSTKTNTIFRIVDAKGMEVKIWRYKMLSKGTYNYSLPSLSLTDGIYWAVLQTDEGNLHKMFVIKNE